MADEPEFDDLDPETQQAITDEVGIPFHTIEGVLPVLAKYGLTLSDCVHAEPEELPREVIDAICKIKVH